MSKKWPTLGYIKKGDNGKYLQVDKTIKTKVDGNKLDLKYINVEEVLTVYDKETKTSTQVGRIIKKNKNGKTSTFIQFNDNIEFGKDGKKIDMAGLGFLQSKQDRLRQLDKAEEDGKIDEATAEKVREAISYSEYEVVLPPPKND